MLAMAIMRAINTVVQNSCVSYSYETAENSPRFDLSIKTEWGTVRFVENGPNVDLTALCYNGEFKIASFNFGGFSVNIDEENLSTFNSFKKLFFKEFIEALEAEFRQI